MKLKLKGGEVDILLLIGFYVLIFATGYSAIKVGAGWTFLTLFAIFVLVTYIINKGKG